MHTTIHQSEGSIFRNHVNRAARLAIRLANIDKQRDAVKKKLDAEKDALAALAPVAEQAQRYISTTDGGGKSWSIPAQNGSIVRVTQPGKRIVSEVPEEKLEQIRKLCGHRFVLLFEASYSCV